MPVLTNSFICMSTLGLRYQVAWVVGVFGFVFPQIVGETFGLFFGDGVFDHDVAVGGPEVPVFFGEDAEGFAVAAVVEFIAAGFGGGRVAGDLLVGVDGGGLRASVDGGGGFAFDRWVSLSLFSSLFSTKVCGCVGARCRSVIDRCFALY